MGHQREIPYSMYVCESTVEALVQREREEIEQEKKKVKNKILSRCEMKKVSHLREWDPVLLWSGSIWLQWLLFYPLFQHDFHARFRSLLKSYFTKCIFHLHCLCLLRAIIIKHIIEKVSLKKIQGQMLVFFIWILASRKYFTWRNWNVMVLNLICCKYSSPFLLDY